ncbi:HpcH/HpaI aldolase/citrate lyase family protein [Micromonospora sp. NPDC005163]
MGELTVRTALYVAAHRARHLAKAWTTDADALVLELEDGVPPDAKEDARAAVRRELAGPTAKPAFVRVNGLDSGMLRDDLMAVAGTSAVGVRVPKVEAPSDVATVAGWLEKLGSDAGIVPILETARAIQAAPEIASAHPRVMGLLMGEEDLAADLGCGPTGLLYARSRVVLAARAAGLPAPLQSVWTRVGDIEGLRADSEAGRELGFHGRSVIHPSQIGPVHAVYTPTPQQVAEAEEIVRRAGTGGSLLPDGRFVDDATVAQARRILAQVADGGRN